MKTGYQVRTGHRVQIVYVHGDGWRPEKECQFVQEEKVRVVTLVLPLKSKFFPERRDWISLQLTIAKRGSLCMCVSCRRNYKTFTYFILQLMW